MSLQSAFISHQIWLQRYSTQEANTFEPYLRQLRNEIRAQVLGFGDDSRTKARLIVMLKDLENALYGITSDWDKQLLSDLKDLSIYESQFTAETLQKNVAANFTTPTPEQVWTAIKFQPLQLEGKPVDFTRLLASWSETEVSRLTMGVKTGFVQGLPTRQIVKQVIGDGSLIDVSERHVKSMVHTAIAHVSNQARETTYQKNNDIIEGYQWVSTLDRRTTPTCRSRDGQKFYSTDDFQPKPPAHVNCLTGDTDILTCSDVSNVYKRPYKGVMVNVLTKAGRALTITPNHPVLTARGWVAAGALNLTDKLICCDNPGLIVQHHKNSVKAKFSEIFSALDIPSNSILVTNRPTTTEDFHGDGTDGEVKVISVDGFSWGKIKARFGKNIENHGFPFRKRTNPSLFGFSVFNLFSFTGLAASSGSVGLLSKSRYLLRGASRHSCKLLLTSISKFAVTLLKGLYNRAATASKAQMRGNAVCADTAFIRGIDSRELLVGKSYSFSEGNSDTIGFENSLDWLFTAAEQLPDAITSEFVDGIEFDDVLNLRFSEFDGHVYNLENKDNWYVSNGIITHNCRSTTAPLISSEFDFLDKGAKRAARGADGGQQVDADVTYYDFLAKQPAWFQDEALGPVRGKIFRNSGMTPEEFRVASVDGFGNPLTIKEMAALDKRVADYLNQGN